MLKNWFSIGGLLVGLSGSLMSLIVCYDYIFGESFKGLDFLLFLLIMLPAICTLVTSFVACGIGSFHAGFLAICQGESLSNTPAQPAAFFQWAPTTHHPRGQA